MASSDLLQARYDQTPYRDPEISEFDLGRLLGLARLFGTREAAAEQDDVRVLDLACASGTHVRAQAARYPGVRFTGVDFSQNEIDLGCKEIERAGLENVELVRADLREYEPAPRQFDVVLCHGAFSWVPDEVKERIFEIMRTALEPTGVGAVAYLTYPGWKQREAVRELVAHHASRSNEPEQRVRDAALVLRLLQAGYAAGSENPHARSLLDVVESMQRSSKNAFLHDELGDIHDPCYFTQFVEWAGEWGLDYLCESDLGTMSLDGIPPEAQGLLQQLAPDFVETQQLIDFLVNRSGRSSLLIPSDARVSRELCDPALHALRFSTRLRNAAMPDPETPQARCYFDAQGRRVEFDAPAANAIVAALVDALPGSLDLAALERGARAAGSSKADGMSTLRALIARGHVHPIETL